MKNRLISITTLILGLFFVFYDFLCISLNPGTFLDNLTSFTHIWLVPGLYFIFLSIFRIIKKKSFWSTWKKWIKILVSSCLVFTFFVCTVNLLRMQKIRYVDDYIDPDYVILLGGGISKDGILPKNVQYRAETTGRYLLKHTDSICVVTGGTLKFLPYPEAPALKKVLMDMGVEENRILLEDKALDTIQNLQLSSKMLSEFENCEMAEILEKNIVISTSKFHIARAERLAARMGFKNIYGIGAKTSSITVLSCYLREILAYVKLDLRILLTGKPKSIL